MKKFEQAKAYKKKAQSLYQNEDYFESLIQLHKAVKIFEVEGLNEKLK